MLDLIADNIVPAFLVLLGFQIAFILIVEAIRQAKVRRSFAEFRRQKRQHQAEIEQLRRSHTSELSALRETIRQEKSAIRPHTAVEHCKFARRKLLNKAEFALFARLESFVPALPKRRRLFCQVSLLEFLDPTENPDHPEMRSATIEAIKAFRVDFLIINGFGYPELGIEYQGTGHVQGNSGYRDQIKREVFRKAGIPLLEVDAQFSWPTVENRIRELLVAQ